MFCSVGLYRGQTDNPMVVPKCSRSGDIIEPLSVPQWFCNCDSMAKKAVDVVRSGVFGGVGRSTVLYNSSMMVHRSSLNTVSFSPTCIFRRAAPLAQLA